MLSKPAWTRCGDRLYISLVRVKVQKHGGRARFDGSSGLGWSSKYGKYEGWNDWMGAKKDIFFMTRFVRTEQFSLWAEFL